MFKAFESNQKIPTKVFALEEPKIRSDLLEAQHLLKEKAIPVLVIISGVDGAGKGEVLQKLTEWLDPRGIDTHAFYGLSDEEKERPEHWQYWRRLPSKGRIAFFLGSWYTAPIIQRVYKNFTKKQFVKNLNQIRSLEKLLTDDGMLIIKLWYHLSRRNQEKRLNKLSSNPRTQWRVTETDWKHFKLYDRFYQISERALAATHSDSAPWYVIEATDKRYRELTTGKILLQSILKQVDSVKGQAKNNEVKLEHTADTHSNHKALEAVDFTYSLDEKKYSIQLKKYREKLGHLMWKANDIGISNVVVFEGWDAAGKGSAIRRIVQAVDPRLYSIVPIAGPTSEELAHHYLWRFWRHLPRKGRMTLFDRSWYGRVLVERIEGFARPDEWQRAYQEINDFEEQLVSSGILLTKFWLHISKDEQLRRFKEREKVLFKRYKITEEDWRNRHKWQQYETAINDMIRYTSTVVAPWTVVASNDKRYARVTILKTLVQKLKSVVAI